MYIKHQTSLLTTQRASFTNSGIES